MPCIVGLSNDNLYRHKDFDPELAMLLSRFITRLDAPVCLVAHNGMRFDFGLLQVELQSVGQSLPDGVMCVDSLLLFQHIDLAEGDVVAEVSGVGFNRELRTPRKQVTSPELAECSSSARKRKPELVVRRVSLQTAKKRLFEASEIDGDLVALSVDDVTSVKEHSADETTRDDTASGESSSCSWTLDVTDSELLAADIDDARPDGSTSSLQDAQNTYICSNADTVDAVGASDDTRHSVEPCTKSANSTDDLRDVSDTNVPCNATNGTAPSTPYKAKLMTSSILMNTPPFSPHHASKLATLVTSGPTSKMKKLCYTLTELHKRVVGYYPQDTHSAEGDCIALARIFQNSTEKACEWADRHAIPFSGVPPLYTIKARRFLPQGTFPYQI